MRSKTLLIFAGGLFLVPIAQGQKPTSHDIISVSSAPSGACTAGLPNQQVVSTGTQYSCQNGTWGAIGGSGSGTVNAGTAGQVAYYPASAAAVGGAPALSLDTYGNLSSTQSISGRGVSSPSSSPLAYYAFGDSITHCTTGITIASNCYPNHLALDLGTLVAGVAAPVNRSADGDESADVVWRIQSGDNPAVTGTPAIYTLMIGTNDADQHGVAPTTWEANYKLFHTAALAWFGIPASAKVAGSTATTSGTCSNETTFSLVTGEKCTANASTLTFSSVVTAGAPIDIWYRVISADTGTFTYAVDGGATTSVNTAPPIDFNTVVAHHTSSMGLIRVTGVAAGTHSIVFTQTNAGTMSILAVGSLPSLTYTSLPAVGAADVPNQLDGTKAAATAAYAVDALTDIRLLAGDGLNISYAPVNSTLQATTAAADMFNTLHPNDVGHLELYRSFRSAMRISPAYSFPLSYNPASSGTLIANLANWTMTNSTAGASVAFESTLNSSSGSALIATKTTNGSAANGQTQYLGGTQTWFEGVIPGAGTSTAYVVYNYSNSHAIVNLPSNTMPANSYGGNASGPVLLTVQTPAARKGTFVCTAGGTITISNANEALTSDVVISLNTAGGTITTPPAMKTVTAATGFTVLCGASDTSTYNYNILN